MNPWHFFSLLVVWFSLAFVPLAMAADPSAQLAEGGRIRVVIVLPQGMGKQASAIEQKQSPTAKQRGAEASTVLAATELVNYLEKITGQRPPIRTENKFGDAAKYPLPIYVGACQANAALTKEKPLAAEEYLVKVTPERIHLVGGDAAADGKTTLGTAYAVYAFLEDSAGVRWLFPTALGEVVPKAPDLSVSVCERRNRPTVAVRKIRNKVTLHKAPVVEILKEWGVDLAARDAALDSNAVSLWLTRQRIGGREEIDAGHSFAGFWDKNGKEHPEWFAMQPDGTRTQKPPREHLCVSNAELWDAVAKERIAEFKADPHKRMVSICLNDGGSNTFCSCPKCRALDPANAPKINHPLVVDPATKQPYPSYPAHTDRNFTFFNEVAKRIAAVYPDKLVACYAYSVYRTPPVNLKALEPNLVVGYVGLEPKDIGAWSKLAKQLFIRPNELWPGSDYGIPHNNSAFLAEAVRFAHEHNAIGFDFDGLVGNWGSHGLACYTLARALSDPTVSPDAIADDYCKAAFGKGASAMREYYRLLAMLDAAQREKNERSNLRGNPAVLLKYYTSKAFDDLQKHIDNAKAAIGSDDKAARDRIAMVEDTMAYGRKAIALLSHVAAGKTPEDWKAVAQERAKMVEFLKPQAASRSFNSAYDWWYLKRALNDVELQAKGLKLPPPPADE